MMSLLSLPNEILFAIADYLKLLPDLNAFAQTNHRCYATFNRQLYVCATKEVHNPGFLWALENGQPKTVQYFLDVGAITGPCAAETIQTSLIIAARHECPRTVALLITYGANMCGYMKTYCQAALAEAVKYGRVEVVKVLLDNGADLEYVYEGGKRPLQIAAKSNNGPMIKFLFGCGVSFYAFDQSNTSALHMAAMKGKENAVRALLDCGFNPNFIDYEGDAPIHCVAKAYRRTSLNFSEVQLGVTRALLEYGADPYLKNRYGFMPLWVAAFLNRTVFLDILLKYGVNPHGLDANGNMQEPMPIGEFRVMVRERLSDYTSHYPQLGHDGHLNCCTPLCIAAFLGCEGAVKLLLEHGANPNGIDPNGEMPLHLAVRDKNCAVAERLIKHGASLESRDCHGRTPIDWALSFGGHEMIQLLRDKGASARSIDWRGVDPIFRALDYGHTADWAAVRRGLLPPHIVDWADDYTIGHQQRWPYYRYPGDWNGGEPHECESVVEWLLDEGSKVDSRDSLGRTLLHQAAFQNCEGTIKLLLKRGADPMSKDLFGQTPLHMACAPFVDLAEDAFEILLEAGSDPNSRDINGETPLHQAARAGFYWAPHLLRAHGRVDFMAKNNNGNTALHLAVLSGRGEEGNLMIKALRRAGVDCSMVNNNGQTAMDLTPGWSEESTIIALSCELSEEPDEYEYEEDLELL
ncbi:hypothetical protein N7491_001814 [Penicillium cf. griseofulvum]|uniref:F-box domain-containing protein n=1 Tax=Penicillium cf. griseofulvum TaxID=2972120 RepID=A0A9W9MU64_9EURO|nr:hypothetical protein N7472_006942 [Penicillium cf. griseofulvum]KAJ5207556.1 hypothetical protein N7472_004004 [Penicillium cf. griseofulvum]KAJ5445732.1 hypothetical protein N7491_001814 [Penicillium cf. griseofulvum]KAJ5447454.1 hypothetical protein N7445_002275 [Penicillium cf. griseofulvum]